MVAEVPSDFVLYLKMESKRKALNRPNRTQGAAHTATTSATTQPSARVATVTLGSVANHVNQLDLIYRAVYYRSAREEIATVVFA